MRRGHDMDTTMTVRPHDWPRNARARVVDSIAQSASANAEGESNAMGADLKAAVMPTRELRVRGLVDGKMDVRVM
jgi:hypothetical protein